VNSRAAGHKAGGLRAVGLESRDNLGDGRSGESAGREGKDRGSSETHLVGGWLGINMYVLNRKISTRSEIVELGWFKGRSRIARRERTNVIGV
jgi:hypothetical protein